MIITAEVSDTDCLGDDGIWPSASITLDSGEKIELEPCEDNGWDWNGESVPTHYKLVETSYKNQTNSELVVLIRSLNAIPGARYKEGVDIDGDYFWRVWFSRDQLLQWSTKS
jgi:hypothetical protein